MGRKNIFFLLVGFIILYSNSFGFLYDHDEGCFFTIVEKKEKHLKKIKKCGEKKSIITKKHIEKEVLFLKNFYVFFEKEMTIYKNKIKGKKYELYKDEIETYKIYKNIFKNFQKVYNETMNSYLSFRVFVEMIEKGEKVNDVGYKYHLDNFLKKRDKIQKFLFLKFYYDYNLISIM